LISKTWSARNVEPLAIDPTRESRRIKILPHLFLKEFNESLYIDGFCILKKFPVAVFKDYLRRDARNFVCLRHRWRDCVYQAAEAVLRSDIDSEARVRETNRSSAKMRFSAARWIDGYRVSSKKAYYGRSETRRGYQALEG
jgi:hypothetical protein